MRLVVVVLIAFCCCFSSCGILEPNEQNVTLDQIDGYYKVEHQRLVKSSNATYLMRGPFIFSDTTVDTFYTEWIRIKGTQAESVGYYHILQGTHPNWRYYYNYSLRAVANITWRMSDNKKTWVGQYNWKLVNAEGSVLNTEINYISHDDLRGNRMTVVYSDNATRIIDEWTNEDPIVLIEVWIKVDSTEYNHWYRKARFY